MCVWHIDIFSRYRALLFAPILRHYVLYWSVLHVFIIISALPRIFRPSLLLTFLSRSPKSSTISANSCLSVSAAAPDRSPASTLSPQSFRSTRTLSVHVAWLARKLLLAQPPPAALASLRQEKWRRRRARLQHQTGLVGTTARRRWPRRQTQSQSGGEQKSRRRSVCVYIT